MAENNKFYNDLISNKVNKNNLLDNLYAKVQKNKGKNQTHFYSYDKNVIHQADVLFLPNDNGYKYLLVVVDLHDRTTDAVPLKTKNSSEIADGFKKIYSGKYLKVPKRILVDSGSEFKGDTAQYFKENNISVKTALAGRHQQQGIVEQKNLIIGKALLKRQTAQEILTGIPSTEWVDDLPHIIAAINRKAKPVKEKNSASTPICQGDACNLLNMGDLVRVALDEPRAADESNKKLHGKFRASDIRFELKPRKIINIYLNEGMPPLYQVEGKKSVAYTKNQLQLVNTDEKIQNPKQYIKGIPQYFKVEKILDKKSVDDKNYYLIKWFGHDSSYNSWEPEQNLQEDVPKMLKEYNISLQPKDEIKAKKTVKKIITPKKQIKKSITVNNIKTKVGRAIKKPNKYND